MKIFSNFISETDPIYDGLKNLEKPITFFYDYIPKNIEQLEINPYNFIMLHEPDEFFGMHTWVLNSPNLFTGILTWNDTLLQNCDNAVLFHHGCNHLDSEYIDSFENISKKFEVSFLSGAKNLVEGHRFRQEIYKIKDQITIPKKWFYVLEDFDKEEFQNGGIGRPSDAKTCSSNKQICFNESMFHVCVENVNKDYWFTEKISDAFNTKTIPIYWGCPKISEYGYDEKGIIRFETIDELISIVNNLTPEVYEQMKPYVDYNYEVARKELKMKDKLKIFFEDFVSFNNL